MTLELDLGDSLAKIHRARVHLETLDREVTRLWDLDPFTLRAGEVDPDGEWWAIYIGLNELKEVNLAPVVGDLMPICVVRSTTSLRPSLQQVEQSCETVTNSRSFWMRNPSDERYSPATLCPFPAEASTASGMASP
jgi:hypothetical protein